MQHVGIFRSVLRVCILFSLGAAGLSLQSLEELLAAQEAHEGSASNNFLDWCQSAKSLLTDRVTARKERISELAGSIESFSARVEELKNKTNMKGIQAFDTSAQEQRLVLIRTESEHWRGVHAKNIAERLLEADNDLLTGLDSILQWEEQAVSKHQVARQQMLGLVRERHLQEILNSSSPIAVTPAEAPVRNLTKTPLAPAKQVQQAAFPVKPPAESASAAKVVEPPQSASAVDVAASPQPELPHPSVVRASSAAVLQVPPEIAPLFGISQLPALQLMQADSPKVEVVPHSTAPANPPAQKSANELLLPMSTGAALPESTIPSPLLSLAGMSSGASTQAASAIREISSQLDTARQMPPITVEESAKSSATTVMPAASTQVSATVAPKMSLASSQHARKPAAKLVAHPPKEQGSPISKSVSAQQEDVSTSKPPPLATSLVAAVEKAMPMPTPVEKTLKSDSKAEPTQTASLLQDDPEDALMAIMTGTSTGANAAATSASSDESSAAPTLSVPAPTTKQSAAFLAIRSKPGPTPESHVASPVASKVVVAPTAAPPVAGPEDPEDALMEVMLQGGTAKPKVSAPIVAEKNPLRKHPSPVLAQTAQQVRSTSAKKRTLPKRVVMAQKALEQPAPSPKAVAPDSTAGVMKNFIQEVSDLAQGEPSDGQADPAEPVKKQQQQEKQESEASMMNSFVQEVTRLAQGEPTAQETKMTSKPTTAAGLALSSDLASLMGLADGSPPASFLQLSRGGRQTRASSRSELAAAALIKDLEASEVSKRLARTVEKSSVNSNIAMLSALREQLEGYQFKWSCSKGPVVARTNAVLQLAETGTSLLTRERSTVAALSAELRDAQAASAQLRVELVAALEQSIGRGYSEASLDLQSLPLEQLRSASPVAASALVALETTLQSDAAEAKRLAAKWVDKGSVYLSAEDELAQTSAAKDTELKQAQRVLSDARTRAASGRKDISTEPGCSEAVHTSGLIAAVYRALDILQE